jgi:hypothetical protein
MRIGIDFDNTIAGYDRIFHDAAVEQGLVPEGALISKKAIRNAIRKGPDGELKWQRLQGYVYGAGMPRAELIAGVAKFIAACREAEIPLYIVSHKTIYGHHDPKQINLRTAATEWMRGNGFFDAKGLGFSSDQVFFEGTRRDKINRIMQLKCTHFIDDLEEIFSDPEFPTSTEGLLFTGAQSPLPVGSFSAFGSWAEIKNHVFTSPNSR